MATPAPTAAAALARYTNTVSLADDTVLITGATSGIGEALAWRFAAAGTRVVVAARRRARLLRLKAAIEGALGRPGCVHAHALDVRDTAAVAALPGSLPPAFRRVDIVVNNAGLALGLDAADASDPREIEAVIGTNVTGLMTVTTALAKGMRARGKGHIIAIGSVSGHHAYAGGSAYCASKFAVDGYMRAVRADLVGTPVRVSVVSPGFVGGTEFSAVRFRGDHARANAVHRDLVPLRPADVADAVLYVATRPRHVAIGEVTMWPTNQAAGVVARVGASLGGAATGAAGAGSSVATSPLIARPRPDPTFKPGGGGEAGGLPRRLSPVPPPAGSPTAGSSAASSPGGGAGGYLSGGNAMPRGGGGSSSSLASAGMPPRMGGRAALSPVPAWIAAEMRMGDLRPQTPSREALSPSPPLLSGQLAPPSSLAASPAPPFGAQGSPLDGAGGPMASPPTHQTEAALQAALSQLGSISLDAGGAAGAAGAAESPTTASRRRLVEAWARQKMAQRQQHDAQR